MSEIIDPTRRGNNSAQRLLLVAPILPGRSEAWRRSLQEMLGSRGDAYGAARRQLGIVSEEVWLIAAQRNDWTLIALELVRPVWPGAMSLWQTDPFWRWLSQQVQTLHGVTLEVGQSGAQAERVHTWHAPDRQPVG